MVSPITKAMGLTFDTCKCGHVVWAHWYKTTGICAHCECKFIRNPRSGKRVNIQSEVSVIRDNSAGVNHAN